MKKLLSLLLALVMMFSTVGMSVYANNESDVVIKGGTVTAKPGEEVEIPIVIEKNAGFAGLNMYFTYPEELTFVSLTNSVSALTMTNDVTVVWDGAANYTGTGNLAVLKLKVSASAAYKEYPVTINFVEAFDIDLGDVSVSTEAGTVDVVGEGCVSHNYTAQTIKAEALVSAGNCRDEAVYYYSCLACGDVELDENHTFKGEKVATSHVGGTITVNEAEANHATQISGYTGDTKCLGCNQIIAYGQSIPADAHTPATTWSTDGTYHWKECAISGCGVVIDGTKAAHYSNKTENKATCQKVAVCDVCGVSYGDVASHNWATTYSKDATGHWYACQTSGCGEKNSFGGHTPDHEGPATEDYGIKCSDCLYEIEAQLAHTHVYDKEVVKEVYKASNATCDNAATYYKSCKCGAFQSNETFSYGEPAGHQWLPATCTTPKSCSACPVTEGEALGHTESTEWKTDGTNHWHICTVSSCGAVIEASKAAHTPDREEPTEEADVLCTECGYMMATIRQVHYHVHSNEWSFNQYEHWHACACSNRAFIAEHEDANLDGKCDICKWDVPLPEGVTAPVATTIPTSPVTGHNSTVWIWTTLAGLFGFICVSANVLRKKK